MSDLAQRLAALGVTSSGAPFITVNGRHGKATPRWGTDEDSIELGRRALGGIIDTDPCSESFFQQYVQATTYYSLTENGQDGILLPWNGKTLCNPPGGVVREFWRRAIEQYRAGIMSACIWIGFSVEQLCVLADEETHPSDYSICYLRNRIPFIEPPDLMAVRKVKLESAGKKFKEDSTPSHGNYVVGIGIDAALFSAVYSPVGKVQHGALAVHL